WSGKGSFQGSILSLGWLTIRSPSPSPDPDPAYRMVQDILHAEVVTAAQLGGAIVTMRSWTADGDDVFVTELSRPAGSPAVPIELELALPPPDGHATYSATFGGDAGAIWFTRENNLTGATAYQARAAFALRVVGDGVALSGTRTDATTATGGFMLA